MQRTSVMKSERLASQRSGMYPSHSSVSIVSDKKPRKINYVPDQQQISILAQANYEKQMKSISSNSLEIHII